MKFLSALLVSALTAPQVAAKFVRYTGPMVCATGTGDPHMTTFDGVKYDCQGHGDYVMSKSLNSGFELQGRYEQVPGKSVTTTQNVVLKSGAAGEPTIEVEYTKQCELSYFIDGKEVDLENGPAPNSDVFQFARDGTSRYFMFASGVEMKILLREWSGDCLLDTYLCIPQTLAAEKIVGILGSPDKNKNNDFMMRNGSAFEPAPLTRSSMNEYCKAVWCVPTTEDNLFREPGDACGVAMKSAKEIIFGPTLAEVKCGDFEMDKKCPHIMNKKQHPDRLYRLPPDGQATEKTKQTLDSCRQACLNNPDCGFYSFGMPNSDFPGVCMGCSKSGAREYHKGFNFYSKNCVGEQKVGELDRLVDNANPAIIKACGGNVACIVDAALADGTLEEKLEEGLRTLKAETLDPRIPSQDKIMAFLAPPKEVPVPTNTPTGTPTRTPTGTPTVPAPPKEVPAPPKEEVPGLRSGPEDPASVKGDPHFKTFGGELYDFHGECDMVLLHNPQFKEGLGMDIHLRTKIEDFWSSVVTAAVKIGESTVEISAEHGDQWLWFNGQLVDSLQQGQWYTTNMEGFLVRYKESSADVREVIIYLKGTSEKLTMKTYKSFVRVDVDHKGSKNYDGALGLLGSYNDNGARFGRDGKTLIQNPHKFGQEWQVLESEPQIFHTYEGAVVGEKCIMPPTFNDEAAQAKNLRRRLVGSGMTVEDAEKACSHLQDPEEVKACVFDVIATQDLNMAGAW